MKIYMNRIVFVITLLSGCCGLFSLHAMSIRTEDLFPDDEIIGRFTNLELSEVARHYSPRGGSSSRLAVWTNQQTEPSANLEEYSESLDKEIGELAVLEFSDIDSFFPVKKSPESRIATWMNSPSGDFQPLGESAEVKDAEDVHGCSNEQETDFQEHNDASAEELIGSYENQISAVHRLSKKERISFLNSLDVVINTIAPSDRDDLCRTLIQNINYHVFNKIVVMLFCDQIKECENLFYMVFRIAVYLYNANGNKFFYINGRAPKEAAFFLLKKACSAIDARSNLLAKKNGDRRGLLILQKKLERLIMLLIRIEFATVRCTQEQFRVFGLRALLSWVLFNNPEQRDALLLEIKGLLEPAVCDSFFR